MLLTLGKAVACHPQLLICVSSSTETQISAVTTTIRGPDQAIKLPITVPGAAGITGLWPPRKGALLRTLRKCPHKFLFQNSGVGGMEKEWEELKRGEG